MWGALLKEWKLMKNQIVLCRLAPAPRNRASLGPVALLILATGAVLALDRDAGAGAPLQQNRSVANLIQWASPPTPVVVAPRSFAPLQHNLYNIVSQPSLLNIPTAPVQTQNADGTPMWNGQGALPGAFNPPWTLSADTSFDPLFHTSYWSEQNGFSNVSSAPWNQGIAGMYGLGSAIFDSGLAYAGKPDFSSLLPVRNPTVSMSRASIAL